MSASEIAIAGLLSVRWKEKGSLFGRTKQRNFLPLTDHESI